MNDIVTGPKFITQSPIDIYSEVVLVKDESDDEITRQQTKIVQFAQKNIAANRRSNLSIKLSNGKALTAAELQYARQNAPELYSEALKQERMRRVYKQSLQQCHSQQEVQCHYERKMNTLIQAAAHANSRQGSSNLQVGGLTAEMKLLTDEHEKFVRSNAYQKLPARTKTARDKGLLSKRI